MRSTVHLMFIMVSLRITIVSASAFAGEVLSPEDVVPPKSWSEFLNATNTVGDWVGQGTTQAMWEGIPAGLEYSTVESRKLDDGGEQIHHNYWMKTADGKVFSSGGGNIYWNADTGQVEATASGFDTGKPYSGKSILVGINPSDQKELWKHTETSRGTTTEYVYQRSAEGANRLKTRWQKVDGGDPWTITLSRKNPLAETTSLFDITGTWEMNAPDGTRIVSTARLTLDGRVLRVEEGVEEADGSKTPRSGYTMFWDPSTQNVSMRGLTSRGFIWHAELESLTVDGDAVTMVSRFTGVTEQGGTARGRMKRVLKGDTLTRVMTDVVLSERRDVPPWVGVEVVYTRVDP